MAYIRKETQETHILNQCHPAGIEALARNWTKHSLLALLKKTEVPRGKQGRGGKKIKRYNKRVSIARLQSPS